MGTVIKFPERRMEVPDKELLNFFNQLVTCLRGAPFKHKADLATAFVNVHYDNSVGFSGNIPAELYPKLGLVLVAGLVRMLQEDHKTRQRKQRKAKPKQKKTPART
jgi:two-component sensor histidine kinase